MVLYNNSTSSPSSRHNFFFIHSIDSGYIKLRLTELERQLDRSTIIVREAEVFHHNKVTSAMTDQKLIRCVAELLYTP